MLRAMMGQVWLLDVGEGTREDLMWEVPNSWRHFVVAQCVVIGVFAAIGLVKGAGTVTLGL